MSDIREMFESNGKSYEAIKFVAPDKLLIWDKSGKADSTNWTGMTGWNEESCRVMNIEEIELDVLKAMSLYSMLSPEVKDKMEHKIRVKIDQTKELMEKARAGRKKKYENIPSELTCCMCKNTVEAIPSKIAKIVEKKGMLLVDYLANFKCRKCDPVRRGKKANPEFASLGKTMKCGCGTEVTLNPTYLKGKAERLGTTIVELVKNFKCQKCECTKGRPKK